MSVAVASRSVTAGSVLRGGPRRFSAPRHNAGQDNHGGFGAYLIGYVLAAVSARRAQGHGGGHRPILVLALPVVNITQVTVRRLRRGSSPVLASNDHPHDIIRSGQARRT